MATLKFPSFQINQPGSTFYVFTVDSAVLDSISYVSVLAKANPHGIQRFLSAKRVKEVNDFVNAQGALLANNIIVNLSAEAYFEADEDTGKSGVLHIPGRPGEAMIIDGQHRLAGFEDSAAQFELTLSAFIDLPLDKQAKLFRDINTEQKGIPTSLAYDLLDLTKDAEYLDLRSHDIVKRLNEDVDSPWLASIKMQGVGPGLITQASFIEHLKTQLNPQTGSIGYLDAERQFLAVRNYWQAIKSLQEEAWGNKSFQLTKTLGFSALMGVFPRIAEKALGKHDFSTESLEKLLKPLAKFDFSGNSLKGLAGSSGRIELRDRILDTSI